VPESTERWASTVRLKLSGRQETEHRLLLSLEETALILGIGRSTIYRAVHDGELPFPVHRIGGRWYVPKAGLQRFLNGEREEPVAKGSPP
jgi:excisionase family DNA binding protein